MNEEIRRLQRLRRTLEKMIQDCGGSCSRCVQRRSGGGLEAASRAAHNR